MARRVASYVSVEVDVPELVAELVPAIVLVPELVPEFVLVPELVPEFVLVPELELDMVLVTLAVSVSEGNSLRACGATLKKEASANFASSSLIAAAAAT